MKATGMNTAVIMRVIAMTAPLISSLTAYMIVNGTILPWWQIIAWNTVISILGVLFAFPMKRRFINEDQLPFPEGRACGVVLDTLYTGHAAAQFALIAPAGALRATFLVDQLVQLGLASAGAFPDRAGNDTYGLAACPACATTLTAKRFPFVELELGHLDSRADWQEIRLLKE